MRLPGGAQPVLDTRVAGASRLVDGAARSAIVSTVHEYLGNKVNPISGEFERTHQFLCEIFTDFADMDLLTMSIPEMAGLDLDLVARSAAFRSPGRTPASR
jgi:hypothetical protein